MPGVDRICALRRGKRQENGRGWQLGQGFGKTMTVEEENAPRNSQTNNAKRAGEKPALSNTA
jgi:hypothetical protein